MSNVLSHLWFFAALLGGVGVLILVYRRSQRRVSTKDEARSLWDYVLLWPLLFEKSSSVDRSRRLLTNRELIGWLVVVALMVLAVILGRSFG